MFDAQLLDKVFKSIHWPTNIEYFKYDIQSVDNISFVFYFMSNKTLVLIHLGQANSILTVPNIPKLSGFLYKLDINLFVTDNQQQLSNLKDYITEQLIYLSSNDDFVGQNKHYGYEITHFRILGDKVWLVYVLNHDPCGINYEIYIEQELEVTDNTQRKQIIAMRSLLEASLKDGQELVSDSDNKYDKPLSINQVYQLAFYNNQPSAETHVLKYDESNKLPNLDEFVTVYEIIVYIADLLIEIINRH